MRPFAVLCLAVCGCNPDYKLERQNSRIAVSPGLTDFGAIAIGEEEAAEITLTSITGGDVRVVSADLADTTGFFSVGESTDVPEGGEAALPVAYHPTEAGWHAARLTITTSEEKDNVHEVDLRGRAGEGAFTVLPSRLDFGWVDAGDAATEAITLENVGEIDLSVDAGTVDLDVFAVATPLPVAIAPGDAATLDLAFSPADDAEAVATLTLSTAQGLTAQVTLLGNACTLGDPALYDADDDGFSVCATDCDDGDARAHPGGVETCDGADQDCDGVVDEGTSCYDDDGDGATEDAGDCNDGDAGVAPSMQEDLTNGVDDDCDGVVDDGTSDADGDGYSLSGGDCDTDDAAVYPGAPELADGLDNDCDGTVDEGTTNYDDDRDGYTEAAGDCDDTDATVSPGDAETADFLDDDCDGSIDEGTSYGDDDDDGWTEYGGDCDDTDADVHPGAEEVSGDRTDDDCDGVTG